MTTSEAPEKQKTATRKPRARRTRAPDALGLGCRLFVNAYVKDPAKLLSHAWKVWNWHGRAMAEAPKTIPDALRAVLFLCPGEELPEEYGVSLRREAGSPLNTGPEPDLGEILAALCEEYLVENLEGKPYREYAARVERDYVHRGTVIVRARSDREAERLARAQISSVFLSIDAEIEGTDHAESLGPVPD